MATPIIAAYDPFREDRAPVELALVFRELTDTPVIAAAVHAAALIDGWMEPLQSDPEVLAGGDRALAHLRGDTGVQTRCMVDVSVPRALHDFARKQGSGLIVVGSTHRGRAGRVLPGSTAERVLHGAECAVALAPKGYRRRPIGTVAVGFVDTVEGRAALAAAHELARRAGARLRAIAALHPRERQDALDRAVSSLPEGVKVETEIH